MRRMPLSFLSVALAALCPVLAWGARRPVVSHSCLDEAGIRVCTVRATGEQAAVYLQREIERVCPLDRELLWHEAKGDQHSATVRCESRVK